MLAIIIAILSGAIMSFQGVFNTQVTDKSGVWMTAMWVQLTAFITCFVAWLICERGKSTVAMLFRVDNKLMLIGGVLGAFITWSVIYAMSGLGPAKAVMIIVVSQILVAYIIEMLGLFGVEKADFSIKKLIGMIICIVGLIIFKYEN